MRRVFGRPALLSAALLALLALGGCGSSGGPAATGTARAEGASVAGTPVTGEVAFARETMAESRALAALAPEGVGAARVVPFLRPRVAARLLEPDAAAGPASWSAQFTAFPAAPAAAAPVLAANFAGLSDNFLIIPPDTMGAAGTTQLLETLNSEVAVYNKTGTQLSKVALNVFWASVRSGLGAFDPRSIYDHNSGRFVSIAIAGSTSTATRLLIGVSPVDDALGTWNKFGIVASADNITWADFDCLGVDDNNVYVTANMFNDSDIFQFTKVWVFPKAQLVANNLTSWTEFINPPGADFTVQPANTAAPSGGAQYFLHEGYADASTPPRRFVRISRIAFPAGTATWSDLGYVEVPSYPVFALQNAPQPGTSTRIETNDTRLLNVVYRNGSLWTTHTVADAANSRTEIAWYEIDPAGGGPTIGSAGRPLQQGRVSNASRFYYFPSIAVNPAGDVALGFSGSSTTEYVGGYYTGRVAAATDNTMQTVALLKAGTNVYTKDFGSGRVRWGDYSATVLDPADNTAFWTLQEYASAPDNTWATWWGKYVMVPETIPNPPFGLTANAVSATQVDLAWNDNSNNETGFIVERSLTSGSGFSQAGTAAAGATTFSDTGVSPGTQYFYRVRATNGAGNSVPSNEATATTPTLPAAPTGLTATAVSSSQINLAWTDASSDETGFVIERSLTAGSGFSQVGTTAANTGSFQDTGLTAGTTYFYRVRAAKTGAGNSAPSNVASATTPAPSGGGGGGGCTVAPGRTSDAGSAAGALAALVAPLLLLAALRRRRG